MEQMEVNKQLGEKSDELYAAIAQTPESITNTAPSQKVENKTSGIEAPVTKTGCGSVEFNGAGAYPYVYALGRVNARFPSIGIEKEFVQVTARAGKETVGLTDQKAF
jgi:hypothetical protein